MSDSSRTLKLDEVLNSDRTVPDPVVNAVSLPELNLKDMNIAATDLEHEQARVKLVGESVPRQDQCAESEIQTIRGSQLSLADSAANARMSNRGG